MLSFRILISNIFANGNEYVDDVERLVKSLNRARPRRHLSSTRCQLMRSRRKQ